jgi:hypothetical protein
VWCYRLLELLLASPVMLLLLLLKWLLLLLLTLWALLCAPRAAATRKHHCFWQTTPLLLLQESGLLLQQRHHLAVPRRRSYLQGCILQVGSCPAAANSVGGMWRLYGRVELLLLQQQTYNMCLNEVLLSHVPHIRHSHRRCMWLKT